MLSEKNFYCIVGLLISLSTGRRTLCTECSQQSFFLFLMLTQELAKEEKKENASYLI